MVNKVFDINPQDIKIDCPFYNNLVGLNAKRLIFQYNILEETGILDNFRICLKEKHGYFKGSSNSDARLYSWIEASALHLLQVKKNGVSSSDSEADEELARKLDYAINLVVKAQEADGYLYTFYQINKSKSRAFKFLMREQELFCLGHLILASVAVFYSLQNQDMLRVAKKVATLISTRLEKNPKLFSAIPKIEYAFILLYDFTKNSDYLQIASKMIYARANHKKKRAYTIAEQYSTTLFRLRCQIKNNPKSKKRRSPYYYMESDSPKYEEIFNPPIKAYAQKAIKKSSSYYNLGDFHKTNNFPYGNCFSFINLKTAEVALLHRLSLCENNFEFKDVLLAQKNKILDQIDNLLRYHLYPNGMLGEYPKLKALHPQYAGNAKTIYGNSALCDDFIHLLFEAFLLTKEAYFIEVMEWLYLNSIPASLALHDYHDFYYRQPLHWSSKSGNKNWYKRHTIPSKINCAISKLNNYLYHEEENRLYLLLLFSNKIEIAHTGCSVNITSNLPSSNNVKIEVRKNSSIKYQLAIRIPSWADGYILQINGKRLDQPEILMPFVSDQWEPQFYNSSFMYVDLNNEFTTIDMEFITSVNTIDERKKLDYTSSQNEITTTNRKAFYKNAVLYYFESALNQNINFDDVTIDLGQPIESKIIENTMYLVATTTNKEQLILAPYMDQGKYPLTHKEIYIPTSGGIGYFNESLF